VKKQIAVVGAVIIRDGQILCAQRGATGNIPFKWEFPGGKVESGETPRQALEREVAEELRCMIDVGDQVESTTYEYDFAVITLTTFYCALVDGTPQLTEHAQVVWSSPEDLDQLDWAPADIPAVQKIQRALVS